MPLGSSLTPLEDLPRRGNRVEVVRRRDVAQPRVVVVVLGVPVVGAVHHPDRVGSATASRHGSRRHRSGGLCHGHGQPLIAVNGPIRGDLGLRQCEWPPSNTPGCATPSAPGCSCRGPRSLRRTSPKRPVAAQRLCAGGSNASGRARAPASTGATSSPMTRPGSFPGSATPASHPRWHRACLSGHHRVRGTPGIGPELHGPLRAAGLPRRTRRLGRFEGDAARACSLHRPAR